jgi:hypothetical protein
MEVTQMTQQERFETAQKAVKDFMVKHGNIVLLGETKKALKVKEAFYKLQDAASDAYWTDEMEAAITEHVTNEEAFTMVEHAIDYLGTRGYPDDGILLAVCTLRDAHKAIGPYGQIPPWESAQ